MGKSSILEAVRYALDINLSKEQNVDFEYKNNLVDALLGSGGKITCILVDDQKVEYRTEKILGDRTNIYIGEELQLELKPNAIVKKPIYFGQKDLSKIGDSLSTEYLIQKLIGDCLSDNKRQVEDKNQEIIEILGDIKKIDSKLARKTEFEEKQADLNNRTQTYKEHKIDKKLEKQIVFNKDENFIKRVNSFEVKIIDALDEFIQEFNDGFEAFKTYVSKENITDLEQVTQSLIAFEKVFDELGGIFNSTKR